MRALADGRVRWGFWPPDADLSGRENRGIWLEGGEDVDDDVKSDVEVVPERGMEGDVLSDSGTDDLSDEETSEVGDAADVGVPEIRKDAEGEASEENEDESDESEDGGRPGGGGFFAALEDDLSESEEEEEEDEEDSSGDENEDERAQEGQ